MAAPLPDDLPPEVEKLLESCFNTNPAQRPTFEQIVKIFFSLRVNFMTLTFFLYFFIQKIKDTGLFGQREKYLNYWTYILLKILQNSQSFKRIGDDEWDQLVSSWNSFAKKMMKEEKEKMDEMVKQESVNDTTSDTVST